MSTLPLLILLAASSFGFARAETAKCYTNNNSKNDQKNTPCVGLWKYDGKEYEGCANPSNSAYGLWCPTETNSDMEYTKWGYCNMEIDACNPEGLCITYAGTVPNTPCVKGPWKYKGVEYTGCANPSSNELGYWCPTEVTANGDYISKKWGYCNMEIASCNPQGTCFTKSGNKKNMPCVSGTWKYGSYPEAAGCANPDNVATGYWCPIKVTSDGAYIEKEWGTCNMEIESCIPGGQCFTNAGTVPNMPCVEGPWKYKGVEYTGCANPSENKATGLWCPTEVTSDGDYISGKWGACNMALKSCNPEGKICVTNYDGDSKNEACVEGPWKYESEDTEYEGCANPDNTANGYWCPTKLDSDGRWFKSKNPKDWGYCDMTMYSCNPGVQPEEVNQAEDIDAELAKHPELAAAVEYSVSLAWKTPHDLDLIMLNVQTNETVYWGHLESNDGNTKLNLDNQGKKNIPDEENSHVENISFNPDVAGIYSVYVKKFPSPASEEDIPFTLKLKWGAQKTQVTHTAWDIKKLGQGAGSSSDPGSLKKYMWLTTINHNPQA